MNVILNELSERIVLEEGAMGTTLSTALIDPVMARKLLSLSRGNRPLSKAAVNKYKRHMENGTWDSETPTQFIMFDTDGVLINGHHTLNAVVKSGCTIKLFFMFNMKRSAYIDGGRTRTEADRFCMEAGDRSDIRNYRNAVAVCGVLRQMSLFDGLDTEAARYEFINEHADVFTWMAEELKTSSRQLSTAPIRAAILLAKMNGAPGARLAHFWDVLQTGFSEAAGDRSIITFRDWARSQGDSRSLAYRMSMLYTASDVLAKWLDNQRVRNIQPAEHLRIWGESGSQMTLPVS